MKISENYIKDILVFETSEKYFKKWYNKKNKRRKIYYKN